MFRFLLKILSYSHSIFVPILVAMATIKYSKYRLIGILFIGLLCIYSSQAIIMFCGPGTRAQAGELLLFIVGFSLYLFFDCMLPLEKKQNKILNTNNIAYVGWLLVFANWVVVDIYHLHLLSWLNMAIYTVYFAHLFIRIWRHKPLDS